MKRFYDREDIDIDRYNSKFQSILDYQTKPTPALLKDILSDPTTFINVLFQVDGQPLKLYPYQDLIINDPHRYIIFRSANQTGKSLLLDAKAARNLLIDHDHGHNEAIVSKSLPQSIFQMRRVKGILRGMQKVSWDNLSKDSKSMSVISIPVEGKSYSNMLVCAPCTEGLLGYDLHELNLDEFEYWDNDLRYFLNQIAQPRTYSTKGNITIFSNPNGQDSFVAELETQKLLDGTLKWHTYIFNYMDKPGNTQQEYDELKHTLSRQEFESTVAAIRSLSDRNYFSPEEISNSYDSSIKEIDMVSQQPIFFLDVGAKHDQSVLVGGYVNLLPGYDKTKSRKENLPFVEFRVPIIKVYPVGYPLSMVVGVTDPELNIDSWQHVKSVKEIISEWTTDGIKPLFGVDVTGNSGISPLFNAAGLYPSDITFSGPKKSAMYQRFKYIMEKGLLKRCKSKEFEYQAAHLEAKKSARGYLMIHHASESDLDDTMDATAGFIHLADNPEYVPVTVTPITTKPKSKKVNKQEQRETDMKNYMKCVLGVGQPKQYGRNELPW